MDSIVCDTNILYSALRSNRGASFQLVSRIGTGLFDIAISVALVLEYESVLKRESEVSLSLSLSDIDDFLDYICAVGKPTKIFYLWRPTLRHPADDMVLETAIAAQASAIVTFNERDFRLAHRLGVDVITPQTYLSRLGVSS